MMNRKRTLRQNASTWVIVCAVMVSMGCYTVKDVCAKVQEVESKILPLEQSILSLKAEKEKCLEKIESLEVGLARLEADLAKYRDGEFKLTQDISAKNTRILFLHEKLEDISFQIKKVHRQRKELEDRISSGDHRKLVEQDRVDGKKVPLLQLANYKARLLVEIRRKEDELDLLKKERQAEPKRLRLLQKEADDLEISLEELNKDIGQDEESLGTAMNRFSLLQADVKTISSQLAQAKDRKAALKQKLKKMGQLHSKLEDPLKQLRKQRKVNKKSITELQGGLDRLRDELKDAQDKKGKAERLLYAEVMELDFLHRELKEMEPSLKKERSLHVKQIKGANRKISQAERGLQEQEDRIEGLKGSLAARIEKLLLVQEGLTKSTDLMESLKDDKEAISGAAGSRKEAVLELDSIAGTLNRLQGEKENKSRDLAELGDLIDKTEKKLDRLGSQKFGVEADLSSKKEELYVLRDAIKGIPARIKEVRGEYSVLKEEFDQVTSLQKENKKASADPTDWLKPALAKLDREEKELRKDRDLYQTKLDKAEEEMFTLKDKLGKHSQKITLMQESVLSEKVQLGLLQKDLEEIPSRISLLQEERELLEKEFDDTKVLDLKLEEATRLIESFRQEKEVYKRQVAQLQEDFNSLKSELKEQEAEKQAHLEDQQEVLAEDTAEEALGGERAYVIAADDILEISVYGESDLTRSVRVGNDGDVTYPLLGRLKMAGLAVAQAEDNMVRLLTDGYLIDPQVSIFVKKFAAITILGEVKTPGSYELKESVEVLDAIAMAGGFTQQADPDNVKVVRLKDGVEEVIRVRTSEIIEKGTKTKKVFLKAGDKLFIEKIGKITVLGEVNTPGVYEYRWKMTALDAIALAGGFTDAAASNRTRIIRSGDGKKKPIKARLRDVITKGHRHKDVMLEPGDAIVIPESFL